ncbi:uncharacterized protein [Physcomitrium patens]|uniref:uncharacterized protein isoform X2 n=1 Tax=Physcomitrium patens TaxID=3218 RepID=UPI003CCCDCEC
MSIFLCNRGVDPNLEPRFCQVLSRRKLCKRNSRIRESRPGNEGIECKSEPRSNQQFPAA